MKDAATDRYPAYLPARARVALKARKVVRQASTRLAEAAARRRAPAGLAPDGPASWAGRSAAGLPNPASAVNKGAFWVEEDLARPELAALAARIGALKEKLRSRGLRYTNTAGTFLERLFDVPRSERNKVWENVWTIHHSGVRPGHRALDIGGASTPFSFFLAEMGCSTAVLDNDWGNCGTIFNANHVARRMGWDLRAVDHDVARPFPFPSGHFDRVFSICTIEHLPSAVRRFMMGETGRVLKPGGIAAITFCYDPDHRVLVVDRGLRFGYREKFDADVIRPSGLVLHGNADLADYEDARGFLGAVFLRKPGP
jgi:SAM-dependent methyltransferase